MNKFKKGDRVERIDGTDFIGGLKTTVVEKVFNDEVWFETGTWLLSLSLKLAKYPNPPHKHAELIKAWADGAEIQYSAGFEGNLDWRTNPNEPSWHDTTDYRIKPQKTDKQIKLEKLQKKAEEVAAEIRELTEEN